MTHQEHDPDNERVSPYGVALVVLLAVLGLAWLAGWAKGAPLPFPKPMKEPVAIYDGVPYSAPGGRPGTEYRLVLVKGGTGRYSRYGMWGPMEWAWVRGVLVVQTAEDGKLCFEVRGLKREK